MSSFCRNKVRVTFKPYQTVAYYAVAKGRKPGIYETWSKCRNQVLNFPKARFKKFNTLKEAEDFIESHQDSSQSSEERSRSLKRKASSDEQDTEHFKAISGNERKHAIVYTDGACCKNGNSGAKAGIGVYWGENDNRNISAPLGGRQTNNRAEIHAAIAAIKQAKDLRFDVITIRTDSNFLINSIVCWVKKWMKNGWKLQNGKEVVNKQDFEELISVMNGIEVIWEKVSAHSGIPGNEAADKLAVEGAAKR